MVTIAGFLLLVSAGITRAESTDKIQPVRTESSLTMSGPKLHLVDPWIRPPRNSTRQFAVDMPGDFDGYPRLLAMPGERIKFVHRPIVQHRTQRHGVYVITNKSLVKEYLDGKSPDPCGPAIWTNDAVCQVVQDTGLNGTDCPNRVTLFPLMEIFGHDNAINYTTPELGKLADQYGILETESGSRMLAFDCPWVQGRPESANTPGRTSHCKGGMYIIVEVLKAEEKSGKGEASSTASSSQYSWWLSLQAVLVSLLFMT